MSRLTDGSLEIHFTPDFANLTPDSEALFNVGLVCFDAENVVVPYGARETWRRYRDVVSDLQDAGINTCMLTNMTDGQRAASIAKQLGTEFLHKGMWPDKSDLGGEAMDQGMAPKTHPEMYQTALARVGIGSHGNHAAMVDDQLKNIKGILEVPEYTDYFWTFPNGLKMHPGVLLGRVVEVPVGFGLVAMQNFLKLKNGTYGEW